MKFLLSLVFAALVFGQAPPTAAPVPAATPAVPAKLDKEQPLPSLDEATFLKTAAQKAEIQARYRLKIEQEVAPIQAKYEAQANKELEGVASEENTTAAEACKALDIDLQECKIDPGWKDASGKQVGRAWREAKAPAKAAPTAPAAPAK
jgi:hypothetical protein